MGSINSCLSQKGTTSAVQHQPSEDTTNNKSVWSLIRLSRKNSGSSHKGKNKNKSAKAGGLPPKYQSCRDVLIATGHCESCGKRHLMGNVLKQTVDLHDSKAECSTGEDPSRSVKIGATTTTTRPKKSSSDDVLPDVTPKSNESRPARQSPSKLRFSTSTENQKTNNTSPSSTTKMLESIKKSDHLAGANSACIEEERGQGSHEELEDPKKDCMIMNVPSTDSLSKIQNRLNSEQDMDHVKRNRNVGYVLGRRSGELVGTEGLGSYAFTDHFILQSRAPTVELVCLDETLNIYACDLGMSEEECSSVIKAAEKCARIAGRYSAYTYAKQTLGCRDFDDLAFECIVPTHVACQTIRQVLGILKKDSKKSLDAGSASMLADPVSSSSDPIATRALNSHDEDEDEEKDDAPSLRQESAPPNVVDTRRSIMVLDDREPHVVKYDTVDKTRQRLEMHTDKSEWTFLIALSEYGDDYEGGGTFFEESRTTYHLRRGTCLIFPGKLKHCGRKISKGSRFLLVGFLVEKKRDVSLEEAARYDVVAGSTTVADAATKSDTATTTTTQRKDFDRSVATTCDVKT